ncbi:hypothetical protein IE81DRAFT_320626 [Ceraceosorus guamensis]|uniref:Uncharacterized protein n=1 Tax=Ceraceosorus guamensis TaxID=1522189 RepID=A0A316W5U8_9BASI|nr:hypothetical protein IE81DRAFT_320626 [Ceraceosorus guamensis]PWN45034.1 hypothetical protein IE81DRAFT_320626 [Ceraceosorus guamensis]
MPGPPPPALARLHSTAASHEVQVSKDFTREARVQIKNHVEVDARNTGPRIIQKLAAYDLILAS